MPDLVRALAISTGILLPVVILILFVSIAAVRRGEASMHGALHGVPEVVLHETKPAAAAPAGAKAGAKAAAPVSDEISVINILVMGTGPFVVTILLLLGLSLIQHLM